MNFGPQYSLFLVFMLIIMMSSYWRRTRIRRAVRDLSTPLQRQLGPEPQFNPPEGELPDNLRRYAALHRRTQMVVYACWTLAFAWGAFVLFLVLKDAT